MSQTVIKVENLYKEYKLGVINHGTLAQDLQSWWARIRGKEDPNSLIFIHHKDNVEKDSFLALKNVSFNVKQGERIGIIGKNGAGKSTLLKILSKITTPTKGSVSIKGRVGSLLEVGTGFHPELTGRENIYLNGAILGMNRREIDRKLDEIVSFSGVEKHIDTPVKRYSSGMNVRLGFAIAAYLDPEILIVDEVLAVGDVEFQKKSLGKMEDVSKNEGRTILFVSHNMTAIKQLCNVAIGLNRGELIFYENDVDRAIGLYLNNEKIHMSSGRENRFEDDNLKLLNFRFVDENNTTINGIVSNDSRVFIEIDFELKTSDPAFNIGYAAYGGGQLYFWSLCTDVREDEWPRLVIGRNIIRSTVPVHFFNEGDYSIRLYATFHFIRAIVDPENPEDPSLQLSIRGGLSESPYWYNRRPGLCAPVIKWEIVTAD